MKTYKRYNVKKQENLDPELDWMRRIPVICTERQVRLVQRMFGRLFSREKEGNGVRITRLRLPVPSSSEGKLNTLIYRPETAKESDILPCVLFFHGGAFLLPAMKYHYRLARKLTKGLRCAVVMPDYDLGPEYAPPVQQEEAFELYSFLLKKGRELNIDTKRIALAGDSAGGTLCAALCLMARDRGLSMPRAQELYYPSLDARLTSESMQKYTDVPVVNAKAVRAYYKMLGSGDREVENWSYHSPVEAGSLAGMPDTYVETAEFDSLHDDGIEYAVRLKEEGCRVVLNETKGTCHAFDFAKNSHVLAEAMEKRIGFLRERL